MKKIVWFVAGVICGAGLCAALFLHKSNGNKRHGDAVVRSDTVMLRDTLLVVRPQASERRPALRHDTVWLASATSATDSAAVLMPVDTAVYAGDSYRAVVSGFRPRLDSLILFGENKVITTTLPPRTVHTGNRWSVNVTAGAALTPRGIRPALTIGVGYALFRF